MINNHKNQNDLMIKIVSLAKRRGFIYPGSEIYGGLANSWDYGPLGVELKNNIKQLWWKKFVQSRDDMVGIDTALIMNPKTWEASGHLKNFSDPLVECPECHLRFRADQQPYIIDKNADWICTGCKKGILKNPKQFNLMFKTFIGPAEDQANIAYLRPETAQAMFINFKNVLDTTRKTLPFGIAQSGKAFRNEITPGNFIFRIREFDLMEFEFFIRENEWEKWFEYWREEMRDWIKQLGINLKHVHETEIPDGERAHYSKRTVDFEYDYPFGQKELYGLAYRTDFDLKNHEKFSGQNLKYKDPETGEEFWPHVIEPAFGLDRSVLVTLLEAYQEEKDPAKNGTSRIILKLPHKLAPYKAAVFPLLANKEELVKLARKIYDDLRKDFSAQSGPASGWMVAWDDRGNIGKRYYSQDEIGTPYCITVDFDSLKNGDVTVRDRDTAEQKRIKIENLSEYLVKNI